MSWRAELWQKLLQLREILRYPYRALVTGSPGLITLGLLLAALVIGISLFSRSSSEASAHSPTLASLAQIATRAPLRTVAVPTIENATPKATALPTTTPTTTPSPRPPTPTWTPFPTATPVAASPLGVPPVVPTAVQTQTVPLPANLGGPDVVPVGAIGGVIGGTIGAGAPVSATPEAQATATLVDALPLLVPTATPTPTMPLTEALQQPVAPGGMAGIAATATAAAPLEPPVTDAQVVEAPVAEAQSAPEIPPPAPTAASQPTPDGNVRTARVPILMYHYVSVPPAGADIYRQDLSVTPERFAAHLDAIQQGGYTPISLYALLDHLTGGAPLPEKPVVLTFDDGYRDNYENAFPLLRARGMTATFFLVTDFIYDQRPEYLTWDMVREMYAAGMSIEGHGRNHVSLANKDNDYLIWQALGTYEAIQYETGVRPRFISYPAGEYDQRTTDIFSSAGYWAGFTTKQGATHHSDDLFQLRRIRVRGTTTPEELLRLLALDW